VVQRAQAQVDWGDEGGILARVGIPKVYSFHIVLSYSRDPFCCFTTGQDLMTLRACHRRAFAHFSGYPARHKRLKSLVLGGQALGAAM
jgi:transposase